MMQRNRPPSQEEIPVISLFTGAGGLDLGFAEAKFRTIYAADKMQAAVQTYNHNVGGQVATLCDLLKWQGKDLIKAIADTVKQGGRPPRGLIGGPPCQGVSRGNNQSGPSDPRNRLFSRFATIVLHLNDAFSLDFFVFENVPGLKATKNRPLYERLLRRLSPAFQLHEATLDASNFGVPQTRRRLIIVGITKRYGPLPFHFPTPSSGNCPPTVRDTIAGFPPPLFFSRSEKVDPRTGSIHPNHWTMTPRSPKFFSEEMPSDGRSFIRLRWDAPSRTVAYGNREIHVHPDGTRRLSVYEAMRLQGFPHSYELVGTLSDQVTLVSNAVPPPLAAAVAHSVAETLSRIQR